MFRGSLSLGPTLRFGLPPDGRHHYTALMRVQYLYLPKNDPTPKTYFVMRMGKKFKIEFPMYNAGLIAHLLSGFLVE